jgi:hypothetical protein
MIQKLPSLDVEDFECITDFMLEFYRRLGWVNIEVLHQ